MIGRPARSQAWRNIGDAGWHELLQEGRTPLWPGHDDAMVPIAAVGSFGIVPDPVPADRRHRRHHVCRGRAAGRPLIIQFGRAGPWPAERGPAIRSLLAAARDPRAWRSASWSPAALVPKRKSAVGGVGLAIAGVPFTPVLVRGHVSCCAIAQLGARAFVLVPAVVWMFLYRERTTLRPIILLVLSVIALDASTISWRPILIKKGADLPLLLILGRRHPAA